MMRAAILAASLIVSVACTAQTDEAEIDTEMQASVAAQVTEEASKVETPVIRSEIREKVAQLSEDQKAKIIASHNNLKILDPAVLDCSGVAKQGGALLCQTTPLASVKIGRSATRADEVGRVIIGFDRDAPAKSKAVITHESGQTTTHPISVEARQYKEQRIDGLPPSQVSTYTEADLKKIRAATARKKVGFASNQPELYFENGFDYPIKDFVKTSPFGSRRILNGEPKSPHYGVDIAAPLGTPIYAPADGVVGLADEDMYFEGALVMIDHGQGLNSLYLHVNDIFVKAGDVVKRGDLIAEVGSKGRSTGPHLCWRLKWKKENLDPELLTQWPGR